MRPQLAAGAPIEFMGVGKSDVVTISLDGIWNGLNSYAGQSNWQWNGTTPTGYDAGAYLYSRDLQQFLSAPQDVAIRSTALMTVFGSGSSDGRGVWQFNSYAPRIRDKGRQFDAAALDVATWETLYGAATTGSSNNAPRVQAADGGIAGRAMSYLAALYSSSDRATAASWLRTELTPDQVILLATPEPTTVSLLAIGLFALGYHVRRRTTRCSS